MKSADTSMRSGPDAYDFSFPACHHAAAAAVAEHEDVVINPHIACKIGDCLERMRRRICQREPNDVMAHSGTRGAQLERPQVDARKVRVLNDPPAREYW